MNSAVNVLSNSDKEISAEIKRHDNENLSKKF